jgi:hypothetical protein
MSEKKGDKLKNMLGVNLEDEKVKQVFEKKSRLNL